jgi:putative nucleotidyltransferase with HDIG domain
MDTGSRTTHYEEVLRRFAATIRAAQLYARDHPLVGRSVDALVEALTPLFQSVPSVTIGIVAHELVVSDTPMPKATASMGELMKRLTDHEIERIVFERGVGRDELLAFTLAVAALRGKGGPEPQWQFDHVKVGRITADERRSDGLASDMAAIRRLYSSAVSAAEAVWHAAQTDGKPDLPAATQAIDNLADAVTHNRTGVVALTAMRTYDNYTFTHMVNVSILTMGQARALGLDGRLLREFGMAALMHDIGKVRTPKEILNKPERLTEAEFVIMRRHTVDGAEILRRTPGMPTLAPVVAFEHHLRIDGSGYPVGVHRDALNLSTMLCSIADVYDAMRSQRAYQKAHATERILAVLQPEKARLFDPHLVRRFVQLLGIYPPGNLVKLNTGEICVVLQVHAPDPYRPRVRVLFDVDGVRLDRPTERNLFDPSIATLQQVVGPVDPAEYNIDTLSLLA